MREWNEAAKAIVFREVCPEHGVLIPASSHIVRIKIQWVNPIKNRISVIVDDPVLDDPPSPRKNWWNFALLERE